MGLFHLLSSHYSQIFGVVDVHNVCHSRYYCDEGPVEVIVLSLTAVSCNVAYAVEILIMHSASSPTLTMHYDLMHYENFNLADVYDGL